MKHLERALFLAGWSGLAILLFVVALAGAHTQSARAGEKTLFLDCSFRSINVVADVGSSPGVVDTQPGGINSRIVYFASPGSTGVITVSAWVSVTDSLCYLWSSPAFSVTVQGEFTPTASSPSVSIPYPMSSAHGPTVTVALTLSAYYTGSTSLSNQHVVLTFVRDTTPPASAASAPSESLGRTPIKVDWSASDVGSGVASVSLLFRQVPTTTWTLVTTTQVAEDLTGTFAFAPPNVLVTAPITYELTSQAVDRLGNVEEITGADASVEVWPAMLYLPLVRRDAQVVNGDFESGWSGWEYGQGPFLGHGTGLTQSIVLFDGSHRALLGSPALDDKNATLPVGYAVVSQTATVPAGATRLTLTYRVHSFDTVYGLKTHEYYDTFEFSVDKPPDQITDADRESAGCRGSALNPQDVVFTPTIGSLVFCAGGQPTLNPGAAWDSGWRSVKADLSAFANASVTLYFANWNREYSAPWFNDQGYYNTYTYVDDVWFVSGP